jgi:hypothetical protein
VEMRRRRESQQRERANRAPPQQRRPASPHACLVARFVGIRQGRGRTGRRAVARRALAQPPAGEGSIRRAALRTDGDRGAPTDPLVEPHRVVHPAPAAHLGGPILDEGGVVPIDASFLFPFPSPNGFVDPSPPVLMERMPGIRRGIPRGVPPRRPADGVREVGGTADSPGARVTVNAVRSSR